MLRKLLFPALAAALVLTACDTATTAPSAAEVDNDYALMVFGEAGTALEGTMGDQASAHGFDGRTSCRPFPDELKLTEEQRAEIAALRLAFRTDHQDELEALKAIFMQARAARMAGATRMEIREILLQAKPIVEALHSDVVALHEAIRAVLADEQRAWLAEHCSRPPVIIVIRRP
jgi:Spy/CpxP family protein refolding chaperone